MRYLVREIISISTKFVLNKLLREGEDKDGTDFGVTSVKL